MLLIPVLRSLRAVHFTNASHEAEIMRHATAVSIDAFMYILAQKCCIQADDYFTVGEGASTESMLTAAIGRKAGDH